MPPRLNMGKKRQNLDMIPTQDSIGPLFIEAEKLETADVLRKEARARQALADLKGFAEVIPNQNILS